MTFITNKVIIKQVSQWCLVNDLLLAQEDGSVIIRSDCLYFALGLVWSNQLCLLVSVKISWYLVIENLHLIFVVDFWWTTGSFKKKSTLSYFDPFLTSADMKLHFWSKNNIGYMSCKYHIINYVKNYIPRYIFKILTSFTFLTTKNLQWPLI